MTREPTPERVVFEFADHELVGDVVESTTQARYNRPLETILTVERDGCRYTVPEGRTAPA